MKIKTLVELIRAHGIAYPNKYQLEYITGLHDAANEIEKYQPELEAEIQQPLRFKYEDNRYRLLTKDNEDTGLCFPQGVLASETPKKRAQEFAESLGMTAEFIED